jgi:transposase-like protein
VKPKRTFSNEFKRQVVEEVISGITTPAQIVRKHNLSSGLIYHWKQLYLKGKLGPESNHELALKERIKELECMLVRLTLDNDFLKKALQATIEATRKKESLSAPAFPLAEAQSKGGAKC